MSTLAKIVIGIACLLVVSCAGMAAFTLGSFGALGWVTGRTANSDPAQVNAAAARIADFELPAGWKPENTAEIGGHLFVSYAPGDGHSHLYLVQGPSNVVLDQPAVSLIMPLLGSGRASSTVRIRDLTVPLALGEGLNHDGERFQTVSGVFNGRGGPVFVSLESPVSTWDQGAVDRFIASIH